MSVTVSVEPTTEPLTLTEVKSHLRIDSNESDSDLTSLITEARRYVEGITGRALITQTLVLKLDSLPLCIRVPRPPLQSVTSISYQDSSNATQTLDAANYSVDTGNHPGLIIKAYGGTYPSVYSDINVVTVTYVAGYGAASAVPETLKRAMKLYIEKQWDMPSNAYGEMLDSALNSLLMLYKIENISL